MNAAPAGQDKTIKARHAGGNVDQEHLKRRQYPNCSSPNDQINLVRNRKSDSPSPGPLHQIHGRGALPIPKQYRPAGRRLKTLQYEAPRSWAFFRAREYIVSSPFKTAKDPGDIPSNISHLASHTPSIDPKFSKCMAWIVVINATWGRTILDKWAISPRWFMPISMTKNQNQGDLAHRQEHTPMIIKTAGAGCCVSGCGQN